MFRVLSQHDRYLQSYAKCGVIQVGEKEYCLIDSGDRPTAERMAGWMTDNRNRIVAVYNTHSHTDHIGGNAVVQQTFDCPVYAPPRECGFVRDPSQGLAFVYGGRPPHALHHPPLFAEPSDPRPLTSAALPPDWQILPLGGHSPETVGFLTPDGTAFLADCLCGKDLLDRYPLTYIYDVAAYLQTLERVNDLDAACYLPSHAAPTDNLRPLVQYNRDKVWQNAEHILSVCRVPQTFENLFAALLTAHGMTLTFPRYALVGSTLRNYLSWLQDTGELTLVTDGARLKWQAVSTA